MAKKDIAIVTGATSGLGREFMRLLAEDPTLNEIWGIARTPQDLRSLCREMGEKVKPYSLDLSDTGFARTFALELKKHNPHVRYLINDAGFAKFCSFGDLSVGQAANMVDLNCTAVVAMCLLCLPHMGRGDHILNISSQAAFQPVPYQNLYSATKVFVRHYSRALHVELRQRGISVTAVCPGWMSTRLYQRAEIGAAKGTHRFVGMVTPDKVAAKALRDARRGKDMSVYGLYVKSAHLLAKWLPQRVVMAAWLKQQGL